jgi:hypothetical protein
MRTLVKVAKALDLPPSEVIKQAGRVPPPGIDDVYTSSKQRELQEIVPPT